VGGQADQIVLWRWAALPTCPPPQRPEPVLWSIAAGPLVNVALVPVLTGLWWFSRRLAGRDAANLHLWLYYMSMANLVLLIFNMLPVYRSTADNLRALLWFPFAAPTV